MLSNKSRTKHKFEFEAIGTHWSIEAAISSETEKAIYAIINHFDKTYSRFRKDSFFLQLGQQAGHHTLPQDAQPLLDFYIDIYEKTDARVTPIIGEVMQQAGYDSEYSFRTKQLTKPPVLYDAVEYNFPKLTIKKPVVFDFGAAGKGYLVDIIGQYLIDNEVDSFCINAGGDILVHNSQQTIGLEHPDNHEEAIGVLQLANGAVCGSAGNRRKWNDFHHTIDPHTLTSPKDIQAIWVCAETTMLADGLATALYFVSPQQLAKYFKFEYAMIKDGNMYCSQNFKGDFFSETDHTKS